MALEADLLTWFRVNGYPPEDFEFLVQLSLHVGNDLVDLFEAVSGQRIDSRIISRINAETVTVRTRC